MDDLPPTGLPFLVRGALLAATVAVVLVAAAMAWGMPVLRQGRLLDAATAACEGRHAQAREVWSDQDGRHTDLAQSRERAEAWRPRLLTPDDARGVADQLRSKAMTAGFDVLELHLETERAGEALNVVPGQLVVEGDRVDVPILLQGFYAQERLVRLVTLDLESPRFGAQTVRLRLRWDYASPSGPGFASFDPSSEVGLDLVARYAPPRAADPAYSGGVNRINRGRWEELQACAGRVREDSGALRLAAHENHAIEVWREEDQALRRWVSAGEAEQRAVQRRLPELLQALEASATGKASLRPGPGGGLRVLGEG